MSVVSQQVNVCSEVQALLGVVVGLVTDVKAGKSAAQCVTDAVPGLVSALGGLSGLQADLADHKDLEVTVALQMAALINVFVG